MLVCTFIFFLGMIQMNQSSFILSPAQQCILKDLSWKLKVRFLNSLAPSKMNRRNANIQALVTNRTQNHFDDEFERPVDTQYLKLRKNNVHLAKELKRNVAVEFLIKKPSPRIQRIDESSMSFEEKSESDNLDFEAVGVHDGMKTDHNTDSNKKILYRRQDNPAVVSHQATEAETERDMKLKLFRLMYDTVKDNDELVRKADDVKKKYDNSSYFEIGFIMGAITDKVNIMSEVALTVERLYDEWKPIEHVNAYEQIANQAIEINHLVDILQSVHKKTAAVEKKEEKPQQKNDLKSLNDLGNIEGVKELKDGKQGLRARDIDRTF